MIKFERHTLENGLKVILHQDKATQIAAINILYNVGARDEDSEKTGFAHLFEHLMFGGSVNIPSYDEELQSVGGENNAFTNNDITNYYITLPVNNLEVGLWLESDRMLQLDFSQKSLDVQRSVVIEEFKQRYLNQPYGDVWLLLKPLAYKKHPYQWATIGKEISHIENATLEQVKEFFYRFYRPNNAILVVAGNIDFKKTLSLIEKWFGNIEKGNPNNRNLPVEPKQREKRTLTVYRDVPQNAIYKTFHIGARTSENYQTYDLISDVLSRGNSSRLYTSLVKEQKLFSSIDAYISGDVDPGLFIVSGKLHDHVSITDAETAIDKELIKLILSKIDEEELTRTKNKVISSHVFAEMDVLNKAMNLAYFELISKAEDVNNEVDKYVSVTAEKIQQLAKDTFQETNSSVLYYLKTQK